MASRSRKMIELSTAPELHPNETVSRQSDVTMLLSLLAKQNSVDTIQGSRGPLPLPRTMETIVAKPLSGDRGSFNYPWADQRLQSWSLWSYGYELVAIMSQSQNSIGSRTSEY
jgi:hypothetical protein